MSWEKKAEKARKGHRPTLKNWERDGMYYKFPIYLENLSNRKTKYESFQLRSWENQDDSAYTEVLNIPMIMDYRSSKSGDKIKMCESKKIPALIHNIPYGNQNEKEWPAVKHWKLETLKNNQSISERAFKVGEDDDGKSIKMKLKYFLDYLRENKDDSPLYIFDSSFDEDRIAKELLDDFKVPSYFNEDLFHLVGESRRPPYRWFLIGPQRSGTTVHIDPLATSAWNTLISGKKRWVLFPPYIPKRIVKGKSVIKKGEDDEAIHYFMYILPRIKEMAIKDNYHNFRCYEFTQEAGETVYIPNGWWHAVLNLTDTVGITQNFCSEINFDEVWLKTRVGRKKMAWKWLCQLENKYSHLATRAKEMNERDEFVMKYHPKEIKRREKEEKRKKKKSDSRFHKSVESSDKHMKRRRIVSPSVSP